MQQSTRLLDKVEINPDTKSPIATIIWLHGLGADGHDFVPIVPELKLPTHLPVRFLFPHAPLRSVTINNGYTMRAWYDIVSLEVNKHADQQGIETSVEQLTNLIHREEELGVPSDRIILAGFSQGSVIALTTGLTYRKKLGGILALSGYLPFADQVFAKASEVNQSIPIFIAHGTEDAVVPFFLGEVTQDILKKHNYPVSWHSYAMGHTVCMQEVQDIREWLIKFLE